MPPRLGLIAGLLVASLTSAAAVSPPTHSDIRYGTPQRDRLDFWEASDATAQHPRGVIIYIHGGGFVAGSKASFRSGTAVSAYLREDISVAAIDYSYLTDRVPLQDILRECARAVQFIRAHAADWHVDKARVAAYGDSAGAGASLWIAFHPDLADPHSADPVARESTRLICVGARSPQFSYDFLRWNDVFGTAAVQHFGQFYTMPLLYGFDDATSHSPRGQRIRADCDMLGLISQGAPPVFLTAGLPTLELKTTNQFLHHPKHALLVYERCRALKAPVIAQIPAYGIFPPESAPQSLTEFMIGHLKL